MTSSELPIIATQSNTVTQPVTTVSMTTENSSSTVIQSITSSTNPVDNDVSEGGDVTLPDTSSMADVGINNVTQAGRGESTSPFTAYKNSTQPLTTDEPFLVEFVDYPINYIVIIIAVLLLLVIIVAFMLRR